MAKTWQMAHIRLRYLMQSGLLSHSSYIANLSTLCWHLCAQSHITEQDLPTRTVLIGCAPTGTLLRLSPSCYAYFTQHWIQVGGKLADAAHCRSLCKIVKADWQM